MRARSLTILVILAVLALAFGPLAVRGQEPAADPTPSPEAASSPGEASPAASPGASPEASPTGEASPEASPSGEASPAASPSPAPSPSPAGDKGYAPKEGIWISDSDNGRIVYVANLKGEGFLTLGFPGRGPGRFLRPEQVWVDEDGRVFLADRGNNRIIRIDDMRGMGYREMGGFNEPHGVAVHADRIFVADTGNDRVVVYREFGGQPVQVLDDRILRHPTYLWTDLEGNLYVAAGEDPPGGRIVKVPVNLDAPPRDWEVYEGKGLEGGGFAPAQAVTTSRGLFVVDASQDRLVRIDNLAGRDPRELGGYGSGPGRFMRPAGLGTDAEGHLYVADPGNDRIVRMDNISGDGWAEYEPTDTARTLRGPRSVFVWAPRPPKPEPSPSPSKKPDDE